MQTKRWISCKNQYPGGICSNHKSSPVKYELCEKTVLYNEYYWADNDNKLFGEALNSGASWTAHTTSCWFAGEPSFYGDGVEEHVLDLLSNDGGWYMNDVPDDILSVVPSFSGKIGYICEYE